MEKARKEIKPVSPKGNQPWTSAGRTDADVEAPILWSPDEKSQLSGKDPDAGTDWGQEEKRRGTGWDSWMASPAPWMWVWAWCRTGKPSVLPSSQLILCRPFSFCLQSFPASGPFPMSWLFSSGDQSIGASASASILPMNIQGWFPLGPTGLISLLSKGLSTVFSSTTFKRINSLVFNLLHGPTLTSIHDC